MDPKTEKLIAKAVADAAKETKAATKAAFAAMKTVVDQHVETAKSAGNPGAVKMMKAMSADAIKAFKDAAAA